MLLMQGIFSIVILSLERQLRTKLGLLSIFDDVYKKLIEVAKETPKIKSYLDKHSSNKEHNIGVDLKEEFSSQMKTSLENVITGIIHIYPSLGYSSTLNLIIAEFLYILKEENLTFWLLIGLMQKNDLESLFVKEFLTLDLHVYILRILLEEKLPELSSYLKSLGITWDCFIKKFVSALGSSYLPLTFAPQVFDVFFMDGWIGLYKIGVAVFEEYAAKINKMNSKEMSNFIKIPRKIITNKEAQMILQRSTLIQIDKDLIIKSFDSFFNEEASKYLNKNYNPKDCPEDFAKVLNEVYEQVNELTEQHEMDMRFFSQKLIKIEASLLE